MNISYRWHHIPVVATSGVMIELQAYCTKSLPLYQLSKGRELQAYCTVVPPYINEISTRSVVIHQWSGYQHATYKYRFELYTHS
jgi:hypothetical protein